MAIPQIDDVFEAKWSPNGAKLAISHIVSIESATTITGTEEDQRLALYDIATGTVSERSVGSEPEWSASGAFISYWKDEKTLWIARESAVLPVAILHPTEPDVRWVGDQLLFWSAGEIRSWSEGQVQGVAVARVDAALTPRYPHDDVYFSADGARFTMTRYATDGSTTRYLGATKTGEMTRLDDGGATFIEWSPRGETLLLRSAHAMTLLDATNGSRSASQPTPDGTVHQWTADGRLATGTLSPTIPAGNTFDAFTLFDGHTVATLPNLLGIRAFSPDGQYFAGVSRTGAYSTQLELYRCGGEHTTDLASDPSVAARAAKIAADQRRFVRPAAAAITQYVQGIHTGIDVAAPYGTIIVASDDGVVDAIGLVDVGGRRVCVMHADGLESCDYHTALPLVSVGAHVVRGQPVALMGLTGVTTGPHVHWEAKRDGAIVDPLEQ